MGKVRLGLSSTTHLDSGIMERVIPSGEDLRKKQEMHSLPSLPCHGTQKKKKPDGPYPPTRRYHFLLRPRNMLKAKKRYP